MLYETCLIRYFESMKKIPLQRIRIGRDKNIICYRADLLPASIKTAVGACLVAKQIDLGNINANTKAIIMQGGGNTIRGAAMLLKEVYPYIKCISVMYDNTSSQYLQRLTRLGIDIVKSPFNLGRQGRSDAVNRLLTTQGTTLIEQHEEPLVIEIQQKTLGRAITTMLDSTPDAFIMGIGTGGTLFGIGKALAQKYRDIKLIGIEGVGSSFKLYLDYFKRVNTAKDRLEALYQKKYNNSDIEFELCTSQFVERLSQSIVPKLTLNKNLKPGIEGLAYGNPSKVIFNELLSLEKIIRIDQTQVEKGATLLKCNNLPYCESSAANIYGALLQTKKLNNIVTVMTDSIERI